MRSNAMSLFLAIRSLLNRQAEIRKLKGENFNIFSVLKMERLEVRTHSAFIAELLNPEGTHLKESVFLRLFLEGLDIEGFDLPSTRLIKEFNIGPRNDELKTGGRIDIYLFDKYCNTISIENKIDAYDQNVQIERYCNHNQAKNRVYYLTLLGSEPSKESAGEKESGRDFIIISYKQHVIEWLEKCIKETVEQPILRETIKQYLILLKKITNTMEDKTKEEINEMMLTNFAEAKYISDNFNSLMASIGEDIRHLVKLRLEERIGTEFNIHLGSDTNSLESQLWIKYKQHDGAKQFFGVESFSYKKGKELEVGLFSIGGQIIAYENGEKTGDDYWPYFDTISEFRNYKVNFSDSQLLVRLYNDKDFKTEFVEHIVNEIINYIAVHKIGLQGYLDSLTIGTHPLM